jgi:hypothetical protein
MEQAKQAFRQAQGEIETLKSAAITAQARFGVEREEKDKEIATQREKYEKV